jgi:hypothetical protein
MGAKRGGYNPKTYDSLKKLEAKRLLSYYRAEQQRFRRFRSSIECECCGTMHWQFSSMDERDALKQVENKQKFADWTSYLDQIKKILSDKKNVSKR